MYYQSGGRVTPWRVGLAFRKTLQAKEMREHLMKFNKGNHKVLHLS